MEPWMRMWSRERRGPSPWNVVRSPVPNRAPDQPRRGRTPAGPGKIVDRRGHDTNRSPAPRPTREP